MNRKRTLIIILILFTGLFPLIPIPMAKAYSKTVYITSDYDDVWITETGNMFPSTSMVIMLDDETGLRSFLRFQNVPVARTVKINNATLYVYAGEVQPTSPGASVTIYGIDEPDCAPFSVGSGLWSLERPYTSAHVNWNLTSWSMGWHSVDVTNIIEEIINQYAWNTNNSLGFQILGVGDSGHEPRSFEDYYHPYRESQAKLTIVYDVIEEEEEPPGNGDVEFVEQYGEYTIWIVDPPGAFGYELMEYVFTEGNATPYDVMYDYINNTENPVAISQSENTQATAQTIQRKIVRTDNGTIYVAYFKYYNLEWQIFVIKSIDDGVTWINETRISTKSSMEDYTHNLPSIAIDSEGHLHVVWVGRIDLFPIKYQIWYSKYDTSWSDPIRLSDLEGMNDESQGFPLIIVDSNDDLHVVWHGGGGGYGFYDQIWYRKYTTSWGSITRISTYSGMDTLDQAIASLAVDSDDYLYVVWSGKSADHPDNAQIWYRKYTASWGSITRISTYSGMQNGYQSSPNIVVDSNDDLHVVWSGKATGYPDNAQIWYRKYTASWGSITRISTYSGMQNYIQSHTSNAVDNESIIHVLWDGKATGFTDYNKVWYANYNTSWSNPECLQPIGQNTYPNFRWSNFPVAETDYYIVTDENGTVIPTWNGDNETDIDDLKDWIDDYIDPGGGDPLDPSPGTQGWPEPGEDHPFTRFKMRLYFLFIGLGCIFGPLWAMAYKKFDAVGYTWCFLIMVLGVGLLWSITGI